MKKIWIMISLFAIGLLTACSSKPAGKKDSDIVVNSSSERIQIEISENLKVDATVTAPSEDTYAVYLADFEPEPILTREEVVDILYQSEVEELSSFSEGYAFAASKPNFESGIINPATKLYSYQNTAETSAPYNYLFTAAPAFLDTVYDLRTKFPLDTAEELSGLSKDNAIRLVKDLAEQLGMDLEDIPSVCYAFTADQLEEWSKSDECGIKLFSIPYEKNEKDACYYMVWRNVLNGVPVANGNISDRCNTHEQTAQGSYLFVVVGEDASIRIFETGYSYHAAEVIEEGKITIYPEDVPELIADYYNDTIITEKLTVISIDFCYIPNRIQFGPDLFEMTPGYQVCIEGANFTSTVLYFNAITGELF